jgi:hypothetical protein
LPVELLSSSVWTRHILSSIHDSLLFLDRFVAA